MGILDGWRFCPRCAAALTIETHGLSCNSCGFHAWGNSVPGAQAVISDGHRVLLGRRAHDPSAGRWDLPGGFLDEGEHPLDGLRREVLEETGLELDVGELLGFWLEPYEGRSVLCITWLATVAGGEPRAGDDLEELRWFARDELPSAAELGFPTYVEILELWRTSGNDGVAGDPSLEQDGA